MWSVKRTEFEQDGRERGGERAFEKALSPCPSLQNFIRVHCKRFVFKPFASASGHRADLTASPDNAAMRWLRVGWLYSSLTIRGCGFRLLKLSLLKRLRAEISASP